MKFEWSDLRYFLAVARSGSTAAGARALGVNQTTCARRITALERALKAALFERTSSGYELTNVGGALVAEAEQAEAVAIAFERKAGEVTSGESRVIKFSTSDWMSEYICSNAIGEFAALHPNIRIALDVSERRADLSGGEADVALRGGFSLDEPTLIARQVGSTPWSFYCGIGYARDYGTPLTMEEAMRRRLALPAGQAEEIFKRLRPDIDIGCTSNGTTALADAIAGNSFVGPLPEVVGDSRDDLQFCCRVEYAAPQLWIVYPERLRGKAYVREFVDHLASHITRWRREQAAVSSGRRDRK